LHDVREFWNSKTGSDIQIVSVRKHKQYFGEGRSSFEKGESLPCLKFVAVPAHPQHDLPVVSLVLVIEMSILKTTMTMSMQLMNRLVAQHLEQPRVQRRVVRSQKTTKNQTMTTTPMRATTMTRSLKRSLVLVHQVARVRSLERLHADQSQNLKTTMTTLTLTTMSQRHAERLVRHLLVRLRAKRRLRAVFVAGGKVPRLFESRAAAVLIG
jgi:ribosomal protein L18E